MYIRFETNARIDSDDIHHVIRFTQHLMRQHDMLSFNAEITVRDYGGLFNNRQVYDIGIGPDFKISLYFEGGAIWDFDKSQIVSFIENL